jgi:hypothetical protein
LFQVPRTILHLNFMHKLTSLEPVNPSTLLAKKTTPKRNGENKVLYDLLMSIVSRKINNKISYQANIREQDYKKIKIIIS